MRPLGRNPDSVIREIFVCRIRNPRKFCLWNLESWVCGIPNTYQGIRNPTIDLNPESKFLFQRLESIYKGVEKLRKFVYKPHHSSAHFHYTFPLQNLNLNLSTLHISTTELESQSCIFTVVLTENQIIHIKAANCELPSRNRISIVHIFS